jgi:hypothetical protein
MSAQPRFYVTPQRCVDRISYCRRYLLWLTLSLLGRTKRTWKPNVQTKRLWSDAFGTMLRLRVTTHALRCIDKEVSDSPSEFGIFAHAALFLYSVTTVMPARPGPDLPSRVCAFPTRFACSESQGGLDNYLVNTRPDKLDSELGMMLKDQVSDARRPANAQVSRGWYHGLHTGCLGANIFSSRCVYLGRSSSSDGERLRARTCFLRPPWPTRRASRPAHDEALRRVFQMMSSRLVTGLHLHCWA